MIVEWQKSAAEYAVCYVESGMVVGLGSGSTAAFAVRRIGQLLRTGRLQRIRGVPTSRAVEALAREQGIPLTTLERDPAIDVTIDGADEVDPHLNLIKGRGGALLYEKIAAWSSRREIIVVDESKLVQKLGTRAPVPVEVVPCARAVVALALSELGGEPALRERDGAAAPTDEGNLILDCRFDGIDDPSGLDRAISAIPGVVEHGLFLGLASMVVVAGREGVRVLHARGCRMGAGGDATDAW
ncbi:MAG TPA: ribose-5-phosphate isomerase RpiA [Anaerolineae bacterium]|nr:ribose-5-phosphate isomerase RpiA [Anaerolineae bacterium]HOR00436.1 ribose-5-phosphate isomerase RpiA [Anaerolineae bacterium]HPL29895.1 ribose-5-phosphate isomerase RpiA [Anaerolineae bacterium]